MGLDRLLWFDAVWFMGVWERSPAGIAIAMQNRGLLEDFRRALPDFSVKDNAGSPYSAWLWRFLQGFAPRRP